ncbi:MAG: response regulator [Planctomycetaceae bacterium]
MLVVSRRKDERVVFPTLGVDVTVLRISGNVVRLGIDAPQEIPIFRHEVSPSPAESRDGSDVSLRTADSTHRLRNQVNTAMFGLCLLARKLEAGQQVDVEPALYKMLLELERVETEIQSLDRTDSGQAMPVRRRALIVEDNANEAELLAGFLRTCNFDVDTALDGVEAINYVETRRLPEIILLDMAMPRMDGPTTVRRLRENPATCNLRIFAISGMSPEAAAVPIGPSGVDRWFRKPINPLSLVSELSSRETRVSA